MQLSGNMSCQNIPGIATEAVHPPWAVVAEPGQVREVLGWWWQTGATAPSLSRLCVWPSLCVLRGHTCVWCDPVPCSWDTCALSCCSPVLLAGGQAPRPRSSCTIGVLAGSRMEWKNWERVRHAWLLVTGENQKIRELTKAICKFYAYSGHWGGFLLFL